MASFDLSQNAATSALNGEGGNENRDACGARRPRTPDFRWGGSRHSWAPARGQHRRVSAVLLELPSPNGRKAHGTKLLSPSPRRHRPSGQGALKPSPRSIFASLRAPHREPIISLTRTKL